MVHTMAVVTVTGFGIVIPSLSWIRQNGIGFRDEFELHRFAAITIVTIRMQLHCEFAVRGFDFRKSCSGSDL
jgi:hypothetical protein